MKQKEKVPVYSLFYDYLRKVYPEETKNFEPNHLEKADFCKSLESLNSKSLNILREAFEAVTETKFVENNLSNNFYYTFRYEHFNVDPSPLFSQLSPSTMEIMSWLREFSKSWLEWKNMSWSTEETVIWGLQSSILVPVIFVLFFRL